MLFDGGMSLMSMTLHTLKIPLVLVGDASKKRVFRRTRSCPCMAIHFSSALAQTDEGGNLPESKRISSSLTALTTCQTPNSLLSQADSVGIIGGVSVFSTLIFLEKLVWWTTRDGGECVPFVVCSDPAISRGLPFQSLFPCINGVYARNRLNHEIIIENLRHKRAFLEQSGARCIVMPCHTSHMWHGEVSKGCLVPFLDVGECVARELKESKLRPLEAGSNVRIGVLATYPSLMADVYQGKLQNEGFEVMLPDKATMEHIVVPAIEALHMKDMKGARNLVRIAIRMLLVRGVNIVILASDELRGLLPGDDPLLKKCVDPMDALARSTIKWAKTAKKVPMQT